MTDLLIPERLVDWPLIDATIEIRFNHNLNPDIALSHLLSLYSDRFPEVTRLPIADIPQEFKSSDLNLKYMPQYSLLNDKGFQLGIGSNSIVFSPKMLKSDDYPGWDRLFSAFKEAQLDLAKNSKLKSCKVTRTGLRYINHFNAAELEDVCKLSIAGPWFEKNKPKNIQMGFSIEKEGLNSTMRISSNTRIIVDNIERTGSVMDIDTYSDQQLTLDSAAQKVDTIHSELERVFFSSLTESYINAHRA